MSKSDFSRRSSAINPESEWFGTQRVLPDEKTARVRGVFDSVASRYDVMNDLMSGGLHRLWKDRFVRQINPQAGETLLDVAGGTGDVALRCAARTNGQARVVVCDINEAMMEVGRAKALDRGWLPPSVDWMTGNAEALPVKSRSVEALCIAFGLRNVTHIDKALAEFARVLKPGGRYFCLEFSPGVAPGLKELYDLYSFTVLPWLGEVVAEDRASYQYLAESIRAFPSQPVLARRMRQVGFTDVRWHNLMGGVAVIHEGKR
ncbi:MAG: class I SAM-dependent methyltransferase [Alphaproteobacteria bacterium]|nr:class I SAM-dependent methyltransferase [Alphaproteobacteria bacterium]